MEISKSRASFIHAIIAIVAGIAVLSFIVTGCSKSASATLSEAVDKDSATATVVEVNGNAITVTLSDGEHGQPGQGGTPPDMPGDTAKSEGSQPAGEPPSDAPGASSKTVTLTISNANAIYKSENATETQGSLDDIKTGSKLKLTVENGTNVTKIVVDSSKSSGGAPGGSGSASANFGSAATEYSSDTSTSGEAYTSSNADENAVRATGGASVSLSNVNVAKSGDSSSSEDSDFYGLNAGILANEASNLTVTGGTINTDSSGSNGLFAYGDGTTATVSDLTIRTTQGNSGGIEVAGGATLAANNLDIDTQGQSSAAIRSDRGGGTETVTGGTYTTHGAHSPAVYSTADVTVNDATLLAENCEGVVIEGENSVTLNNTTVTGNVNGAETQSGVVNNVMIYQSMSGDADEGTASFEMNGGVFHATHGTLFYVTNTSAKITMDGVSIENTGDSLMTIAGQSRWGKEGSNGGNVTFKAASQTLLGDITVDSISTLTFDLTQASSYTGAINTSGQEGAVSVALEDGSTWTLSGDSYVTELSGDTSGIDLNGHTLYVNGQAWSK